MPGRKFRKDHLESHWKRGDYKSGNSTCVPSDQENGFGQRMIQPPGSGWEIRFFINRKENEWSKTKNPTVFARIRKDFEV
jgi:hypothetical protein